MLGGFPNVDAITKEFRDKLAALDDLPAIRASLEKLVKIEEARFRLETQQRMEGN